ncbi:hypothetical protein Tco_0741702 [Tanacetum coccineum]
MGAKSYARVLIEINVCNDFSGNLVMVVPNLEGTGYTKETILIEYEWELPRCNTCMIFSHSLDDCSKAAPKRVENQMDKGKGQIPRDDDEGFIKGGFLAGMNKASNKESPSDKGNGSFSISNSFEVLNVDYSIIEEVAMGSKVNTSSTQEEGQCFAPLVERINVIEKQILDGKLVLVDDDGKPLENAFYLANSNNDDDVKPIENETASFLASKGVGYGLKHL